MENIRITSGIYRGQSLKSPKSSLTHPMGSREKLALFNMIADKLPGAEVLDVFAGSGALGIEALSRGAMSAIFVEKSPKIAQIIRENLKKLRLNSKVIISDAANYSTNFKYDLILADPPYDNFKKDTITNLTKYLKDDGMLILSHPTPAPVIDGLKLTKTRKYAKANISFYQK